MPRTSHHKVILAGVMSALLLAANAAASSGAAMEDTSRTGPGLALLFGGIALLAAGLYAAWYMARARRQSARELDEARALAESIVDTLPDPVITIDKDRRVRMANLAYYEYAGTNAEDSAGHSLAEIDGGAWSDARVKQVIDSVLLGGQPSAGGEIDVTLPQRGVRTLVIQVRRLRGANELENLFLFALRDVTEPRANVRLIESLLKSEKQNADRLRQIAAAASTLNSAHSSDKVLGVLREEARAILGYGEAVVVLGPEATPAPDAVLSVPLVGRGGQMLGKVELVDPRRSDARQDDNALAILQQLAHIASVAMENARLYEELREGDRRKDEFLATLAHELRNPLAPVRNAVQIMRSPSANASDRERALGSIERQVTLLVRLVDDLLDVSRISRGKVALKLQQVELADIVAQALDISRSIVEASGNTLAVELPSTSVFLEADPVRLAQVVSNLLANASKYTDRGGHIVLACETTALEVVIRVRDDGIGIQKDMLPRIFDMFWQVDHALERAQGGLGIGLTLVRQLVELHGGTVEAHSDGPDTGSEFVIRLPRSSARARRIEHDTPRPRASVDQNASPQRIVVVDDNVDSAESLALLLRLQGHTVTTAHDGVAALGLVLRVVPALVLLDIGLPGMNGYDVARALRAQLASPVVLVAMTGWGQAEDRRRSHEAGFDHHLAKPVDPAQLQRILVDLGTRTA